MVSIAFELAVEVDLVAAESLQPVRASALPNAWAQMSGRFASSVQRTPYQGRVSPSRNRSRPAASAV
jgi:hypothetical protein